MTTPKKKEIKWGKLLIESSFMDDIVVACSKPLTADSECQDFGYGIGTTPLSKVLEEIIEDNDITDVNELTLSYMPNVFDVKVNRAFSFELEEKTDGS